MFKKIYLITAASLACVGAFPAKADNLVDRKDHNQIQLSLLEKIQLLEVQNNNLREEINEIRSIINNSSLASFPNQNTERPLSASVTTKAFLAKPSFEGSQIFALTENVPNNGTFGNATAAEFKLTTGIRTTLGIELPNSNWGTNLSWTSLDDNATGTCTQSESAKCYFSFSSPRRSSSMRTGANGQFIDGIDSLDYDDINLIVTFDPEDSGAIDWSYSLGLKSTNIDKSLVAQMFATANSSKNGRIEQSSDYTALGPIAGIQASTNLFGSGIRAFAGARAGILNSSLEGLFKHEEDLYSSGNSCESNGGSSKCFDIVSKNTTWNPYLGASFGLEYLWEISDSFGVSFLSSYEFDHYANAITKLTLTDWSGTIISEHEDMSLSGLALGVSATYKF